MMKMAMPSKIKKRFIAGAKCPACNTVDSLMLYREHNVEKIECVLCGHQQSQAEEQINQASQGQGVIGVFKPD